VHFSRRLRPLALVLTVAGVLVSTRCGGGSSSVPSSGPPPPPQSFLLGVVALSESLAPGQSLPMSFHIVPAGGFNAPVRVDVSGVPDGVTFSPAFPIIVSVSGLNVTLTSSSATPLGSYTLTFVGTNGDLTSTEVFPLQVAPQATVSVGINPSPVFIRQGDFLTEQLRPIASGGSTDFLVSYSVTGLPAGISATIDPNPVPPNPVPSQGTPNFATLTLTAASDAPIVQDSPFTVVAQRTSDGVQSSQLLSLTIQPRAGTVPNDRTTFARMEDTPPAVVYDSTHQMIFASAPSLNCVDAISPVTAQVIQCIPVSAPTSLSLSPDNSRLLVGTRTNQVIWIDTTQLQVMERDTVPQLPPDPNTISIDQYVQAVQAFQAANGKYLIITDVDFDSPQTTNPYTTVEWDPVAGTTSLRHDSGGGGQVSLSADHSKIVFGGAGYTELYDAATDTFTALPLQGINYFAAINPAGTQIAVLGGSSGLQFFDTHFNLLGSNSLNSPPEGISGLFGAYSSDGRFFYVTIPNKVLNLLIIDTSTFQTVNATEGLGGQSPLSFPAVPGATQAADSTGMIFGTSTHGVVFVDATTAPEFSAGGAEISGNPFGIQPGEGPPAGGTLITFPLVPSVVPDVFFDSQRIDTVSFSSSGGRMQVTSPPTSTVGTVNVKVVGPDLSFVLYPAGFCYGSLPYSYGLLAAAPQGGPSADILGFGLNSDQPGLSPQITIGGANAPLQMHPGGVQNSLTLPYLMADFLIQIPSGTPGPQDIVVHSPTGTATFSKGFHYLTSVTDYPSSDSFQYLLYDAHRNLLYLSAADHVDVFNPSTGAFAAPISVPSLGGSRQLSGLALTPDGSKLLVADQGDASIAIINPDNPGSGAVAVALPIPGGPANPIPFQLAATSVGTAFFIAPSTYPGSTYLSVYQLDLSTLQITERPDVNSGAGGSGSLLRASASGDTVLLAGPASPLAVWHSSTDSWQFHSTGYLDGEISADGNVIAAGPVAYTRAPPAYFFDSSLNITARESFPDFLTAIGAFGGDLDQTGALFYSSSVSSAIAVNPPAQLDLVDTHTGNLRERIFLTQQVVNAVDSTVAQRAVAVSPFGDQIFLATTAGLTVVRMDSVPLGIGSVTPASGAAGSNVTLRGTGFVAGTTLAVNGMPAAISFVDASTLTVTLPSGLSPGPARFVLTNPDKTSYTLDDAFIMR